MSSRAQFYKPRNTLVTGAICDGEDARKTANSFFVTTTNLWSDAFLAGRGRDFEDYDNGNTHGRGEG